MDIYSKNAVEFVTVALEYCAYLENPAGKTRETFAGVMQKILPLLYLKTAMVEKPLPYSGDDPATYVSEELYAAIQKSARELLGAGDDYFDGEEAASISETLADIYQDLKDFTECYRAGQRESSEAALYNCLDNFETYWGRKLISALAPIHDIVYGTDPYEGNEAGGEEE